MVFTPKFLDNYFKLASKILILKYEGYFENVKNGTGKFAEHCFDWEWVQWLRQKADYKYKFALLEIKTCNPFNN